MYALLKVNDVDGKRVNDHQENGDVYGYSTRINRNRTQSANGPEVPAFK